MPPLPKLRIPALSELSRQIRFESAKAARRQLALAEALAPEIEPDRTYPEDWVIFRLTGFRTEGEAPARKSRRAPAPPAAAPTLIVGAALLADLPAYVERLSVAARLTAHDLDHPAAPPNGAWLDAPALCARWRISRKTLDRYRRTGLLARRIIGDDARHRLMFARSSVEAFESRHREQLAGAGTFSRIDAGTESAILRRAERYRRTFGCSLNEAAARLARRFGRSHEAVRQLLHRHDLASARPIFTDAPPLGPRQRRLVERAIARGIGAAEIARRLSATPVSVYLAHRLRRAERLRGLDLDGPRSPTFDKPSASDRLLAPLPARAHLGRPAPPTLAALLGDLAAGHIGTPDPKSETTLAAAYWYLRFDAERLIRVLPRRSPTAAALDHIETRLRWAARLKAELVRTQLALAIKSIEVGLGRPVTQLPTGAAARITTLAIDALIEAVDRFDPFKGGRPAAPAGLALNRAISLWIRDEGARWAPQEVDRADRRSGRRRSPDQSPGSGIATPRADPAAVRLDDWTRRVCPWQAWLEPDPRIRPAIDLIAEPERAVLVARHGWSGEPPRSLEELARQRKVTPARIVRLERQGVRHALIEARRSGAAQ